MQSLCFILETPWGKFYQPLLSAKAQFRRISSFYKSRGSRCYQCPLYIDQLTEFHEWVNSIVTSFGQFIRWLSVEMTFYRIDIFCLTLPLILILIRFLTNHNCVWDLRRNFKIDNDSTQEVEMTLFGIFGPLFRLYKYICTICPYTRCV